MKKKRHITNALLLSSALLFSPAAFALGLGEVQIHSKLNQTLDAEIEILSATTEELNALKVSVPTFEVFNRYDIDRNQLVSNLQFTVEKRAGDKSVIRISSAQPVQEPFVTFLVQADWRQGKLLREYTVLVDPPTFVPGQSSTATVTDSISTDNQSTGTITRGDVVSSSSSAAYESPETYRIPTTDDGTHMVQRGDTLSKIAGKVKPSSVSLNQAMLALYRTNPDAFDGNINRLRAGKRLRVPSQAQFGQIDRSAASSEVKEQMSDWRAGRRSGRLELRVPDLSATSSPLDSNEAGLGTTTSMTSVDTSNLNINEKVAVAELQNKVQEYERLLSAKNTEVASLQDQLRSMESGDIDETSAEQAVSELLQGNETEANDVNAEVGDSEDGNTELENAELENTESTPAENAVDSVISELGEESDADTVADEVNAETTDSSNTDSVVDPESLEAADAPVQAPVIAAPVVQPTPWWKTLLKWLAGLGILAGLGVLGLFGYKKMNNRQPDRDSLFVDDELDSAVADIANSVKDNVSSRYSSQDVPTAFADDDDDAYGIAATSQGNTIEAPKLEMDIDAPLDDVDSSTGGGLPYPDATLPDMSGSAAGLDIDLVSEEGVSVESDAALPFEETTLADATNFSGSIELDQNNPIAEADFHMAYGLYDQATELVKGAIANEDKLEFKEKLLEIYFVSGNKDEFVNYAASVKDSIQATSPGVWDSVFIMGKQLAPDDAMFGGEMSAASADEGLDFAFAEEDTGALEVDQSLFGSGAIELNFDLESELGEGGSDSDAVDGLDLDLATSDLKLSDEDLGLSLDVSDDNESIGLTEILEHIPDEDSTHKLETVDLDLPIDQTNTQDMSESALENLLDSTSETMEIAGAASLDFDMAELGLSNAGEVAAELTAVDDSDMTLDFAADDNTLQTGEFNFDKALFGVDDDPFPDSTLTGIGEESAEELSDLLGNEDKHASTAQITEDDLARMGLNNQEPSDSSDIMDATSFGFDDLEISDEVSTKLDLARAYIEMDDAENAKGILNEVIAEGSDSQANEAKDLLSGIS